MKFSDGTPVSPEVNANFNCLQTSLDFCPPAATAKEQLQQKLSQVNQILNEVQTQAQGLSPLARQKVAPWVEQLKQQRADVQAKLEGKPENQGRQSALYNQK